jgi:sterol carrier protein 2
VVFGSPPPPPPWLSADRSVSRSCVGYCFGDSTCGQRAAYTMGLTGVPVYNVNNNCATGSTAMFMARQFVAGGLSECVLALGFEKMERGSLGSKYTDRTNPLDKHMEVMMSLREFTSAPAAPQMFGNAGLEHMERHGSQREHFAKIGAKNHAHSVNNPYAQFRDVYTLEQVLASRKVSDPLTMLQCSPTSDGAAAAVICSEAFVLKHGLQGQAVEIVGMAMSTDLPSTFGTREDGSDRSSISMVGADMTRAAAAKAMAQAGVRAADVHVVELHDCFSANELVTYESLGLCPPGGGAAFIDAGDNTYGGRVVVNPSGGLISKGHPLGATGLAQCAELCWQLRGEAGRRQVPGAKVALSHNLGLGGAAVVAVYRRPAEWAGVAPKRAASGGAGFAEDYPDGGLEPRVEALQAAQAVLRSLRGPARAAKL